MGVRCIIGSVLQQPALVGPDRPSRSGRAVIMIWTGPADRTWPDPTRRTGVADSGPELKVNSRETQGNSKGNSRGFQGALRFFSTDTSRAVSFRTCRICVFFLCVSVFCVFPTQGKLKGAQAQKAVEKIFMNASQKLCHTVFMQKALE
jgi:hypothetical protein